MSDFEIVDDTARQRALDGVKRGKRRTLPQYDALDDGRTVFFPLNGHKRRDATIRNAMAARGKHVSVIRTQIDGKDGWLAWVTGERAA